MRTRIQCAACGHEGPLREGFQIEGHDPFEGQLYFRCPACYGRLRMNAGEMLEPAGNPVFLADGGQRNTARERLDRVVGMALVALALYLVMGFGSQTWAYGAAGLLLITIWYCLEPEDGLSLGNRIERIRILLHSRKKNHPEVGPCKPLSSASKT